MFSTHAKKRQTDDAGDSPIGSTGFRGGTDTNIFLHKIGAQRIISTEQRWGIALEPTVLLFDEERQAMSLGSTVEEEENAITQSRERSTAERIAKEIWDTLCVDVNPTQGDLLNAVTGKNTAKLKVLKEMVDSGRVAQERDGKATRYRAIVPVERQAA